MAFPSLVVHAPNLLAAFSVFPNACPATPIPAHAAPDIAPVTAPLNAPSAKPSKNEPPLITLVMPPIIPPNAPPIKAPQNAPARITAKVPPVKTVAIPNATTIKTATTIFTIDFQLSLHHSLTDFTPSQIFSNRFFHSPASDNCIYCKNHLFSDLQFLLLHYLFVLFQ